MILVRLLLGLLPLVLGILGIGGARAAEPLPHRAVYRLDQVSIDGAPARRAAGRLLRSVTRTCSGWDIARGVELDIETQDGRVVRSQRVEQGRESLDGKVYRFRLRNVVAPSTEEVEGVAVRGPAHVTVAIERPKRRVLELPPDLLFPIQQIMALTGRPPAGNVEHLAFEPGAPEPVTHTRTRLAATGPAAASAASGTNGPGTDERVSSEARARAVAALAGLGPAAGRLPPASALRIATSLGFRPGGGDGEPSMEAVTAGFDNGVVLWKETTTERTTMSWTLTGLEVLDPLGCGTPKVGK